MGFSRAKEDRPTPKEVYNYRIYLLAFLACLGSWMFGYNNGVIVGVLVLPSFIHDFHLPPAGTAHYNNIVGNIVSFFQIGGLCGSMIMFPVMKYWGRRAALIICAVVYLIGANLQTFSFGNLAMMYIGRILSGIGAGGATVYIAELSPPAIRGSLVGIYEINNQISSLLGYWCNYIVNEDIPSLQTRQWQIPLAIQIVPSSLLIAAALFVLPESPRFLVKQGKNIQARKVLSYIRRLSAEHEYINLEMEEIEDAIRRQDNQSPLLPGHQKSHFGLFKELWWKGNRNRVIIALGLMFGQNLTGIIGINSYGPAVFKSIGFDGTKVDLLATAMYALVKTVATTLSLVFFIDRTGRRTLLIISSVGTSFALWYIGGFITAKKIDIGKPQPKSIEGWVAIVCIYIYGASFSIAWNGVVWIYAAEIFPIRIKELAICIVTAVQWSSQFMVARASPAMLSSMKGGFFFFWAACITIMGTWVWWKVPETKGRTLEGMDAVFGCAYGSADVDGDRVDLELKEFQRERGVLVGGNAGKSKEVVDDGGVPDREIEM